jgi:hypothetical protein
MKHHTHLEEGPLCLLIVFSDEDCCLLGRNASVLSEACHVGLLSHKQYSKYPSFEIIVTVFLFKGVNKFHLDIVEYLLKA